MTPPKRARPALQRVVQVRLGALHHEYLTAAAERLGISASAVVRAIVERDMAASADALFDRDGIDVRDQLELVLEVGEDEGTIAHLGTELASAYAPADVDDDDVTNFERWDRENR